jgi:predicted nucleic acid-binding protein
VQRPRARSAEAAHAPGLVLDAGALVALEGHHAALAVALGAARRLAVPIRIPATAVAQAWRGGPRSAALARLLKQPTTIVSIDERSARQIGEFIARLRLPAKQRVDIVDAHVALTTISTGSLVWTSDPGDMERYGVDPRRIRSV